jgi:DNA (cytosine-5)-methyltransferase 1
MPLYTPSIDSFFSGAGGLDLGLTLGGCTIARSLEYDKKCVATLKENMNHEVIEADIRNETVLDKAGADAMAFTFPCTKYSAIADIHGTRTGDELFLHAFRFAALRRPEAFVLENVPGMKKFKVVMECFTKIPDYYIQTFCPLNASEWLPQNRKRLIIIATRKPFHVAAPSNSKPIKLKDILQRGATVKKPVAVNNRLKGHYRDLPIISDPENNDLAPTCVSHYAKDVSTRLIKDGKQIRPYTVREYARLQGFPDWYTFNGTDCDSYRQIGNAVPVPMGKWIGEQLVKYFN